MPLESLLLSRDAEVFRVVRPTLEKMAIAVEICQEAKKASEILISEKFDAVIVDCDDLPGGLEVLQGLRATPSNRGAVTFALLNGCELCSAKAREYPERVALLPCSAEFHGTRAAPLFPPAG